MLDTPFSPWPCYSDEEINAVSHVLRSNRVNYWTGEECKRFEKQLASYSNTKYAVAVANGTVALDLALISLGIGVGDEVIVTPRTFIASVSCIINAGAIPVFADVESNSQNINVETIEPVITNKTRAIVCVHMAGWPCEMDAIMGLAKVRELLVIEDCAQAHGARYKGKPVGSIGHAGAFSFCQDKIITTGGEGGMLVTNDKGVWEKAWSYKDHGKSWDAVYNREYPRGFRWLHESFGTNWRMTEMQAAIGRVQLRKLETWKAIRLSHASALNEVCKKYDFLRVTEPPAYIEHAYYKYYVFVRPEKLPFGWSRDRILEELNGAGIPSNVGSCSEVYKEKAFKNTGYRPENDLPVAKKLGDTSMMFPIHPSLSKDEMDRMCKKIQKILNSVG